MKIWKLIDKRIVKFLVDNDECWIFVDDKGEVVKVVNLKDSEKCDNLLKNGYRRYELKRFEIEVKKVKQLSKGGV